MFQRRLGRRTRLVGAAVLVCLAALAAYGFTNTNTVPATNAGSGSGAISGYTVTSVVYTLNASNPNNIDQVAFTIAPTSATTVKIRLDGVTWYACANAAGSVTCNTTVGTQATVAPATSLEVVAVQ